MPPGTLILIIRLILAASLYGFLVWALLLIWRDLNRESRQLYLSRVPVIIIKVSEDEIAYSFSKSEVLIGRDPGQDVALNDKTVSTNHARLSFHHKHWWLEDMDSTNGTFLNEEPLASPVVIETGDLIRCGQVTLTVQIQDSLQE
jgi:hypothetical protein